MYSREELFVRSTECDLGVYFPCCCATLDINNKINVSQADKPTVIWVYTFFYIYLYLTPKCRSKIADIGFSISIIGDFLLTNMGGESCEQHEWNNYEHWETTSIAQEIFSRVQNYFLQYTDDEQWIINHD